LNDASLKWLSYLRLFRQVVLCLIVFLTSSSPQEINASSMKKQGQQTSHQLTESPDSASQQEQHKNVTRPRGLDLLSAHNRSRYARDGSLHRCVKGIKHQYDSCRGRHVDIVECLNQHVSCLGVGVVPPTCEPVYGYPYAITSCPMIVENCKCA